jgi:hypothetical protein
MSRIQAKSGLKSGWAAVTASPLADNPLLLGVAGIGFAVSFQTVSRQAAAHGLPGWPALYPIGIDVGILALMNEAAKLRRRKRSDLVPRALAWALSLGTIYVNIHGSPPHDWLGRTLHAIMPALWIVFLELTRWRQLADIRQVEHADPVPLARWVLDPWGTVKLKRRMVLQNIQSYRLACALEDARKHMRDLARAQYGGRWRYFAHAPALLRSNIRKGRLGDAVTAAVTAAVGEGLTGGWESAVATAVADAVLQDRPSVAIGHKRHEPGAREATRRATGGRATDMPPAEAIGKTTGEPPASTGEPVAGATLGATGSPGQEPTPEATGAPGASGPPAAAAVPLDREAQAREAREAYRRSVVRGKPLTDRRLAGMFPGRSRTWGRNRIDEVLLGPQPVGRVG